MRKCKKCGTEKEDYEFSSAIDKKTGREYYKRTCRKCTNKQRRKGRKHKDSNLQSKYGITLKQYDLMLKSQNGVCAICGKPETAIIQDILKILAVDHDHKTFKVRGLLCNYCNFRLGVLENEEWVKKAKKYLERNKK